VDDALGLVDLVALGERVGDAGSGDVHEVDLATQDKYPHNQHGLQGFVPVHLLKELLRLNILHLTSLPLNPEILGLIQMLQGAA